MASPLPWSVIIYLVTDLFLEACLANLRNDMVSNLTWVDIVLLFIVLCSILSSTRSFYSKAVNWLWRITNISNNLSMWLKLITSQFLDCAKSFFPNLASCEIVCSHSIFTEINEPSSECYCLYAIGSAKYGIACANTPNMWRVQRSRFLSQRSSWW